MSRQVGNNAQKKVSTGRGRGAARGPAPEPAGHSRAVVPRGAPNALEAVAANPIPFKKVGDMLVPEGYTMREVRPAEKYDVVSFARAMNDDFAPKLKKLFDFETEAAVEAQKTGIYIGWRCPDFKHDCQRVNRKSRCFCDHLLDEHASYTGKSVRVPCKVGGCACKAYAWIPNRPEDIGEFWFQRRRDFDPTKWRAKCKCKHTHDFHDPNTKRCKPEGVGAATSTPTFCVRLVTGTGKCMRRILTQRTPGASKVFLLDFMYVTGQDWLPFAEMPDLRNIALTGQESDDSRYLALTQGEGSIPAQYRPSGNDAPVNFGASGSRGPAGSGFKPVYD